MPVAQQEQPLGAERGRLRKGARLRSASSHYDVSGHEAVLVGPRGGCLHVPRAVLCIARQGAIPAEDTFLACREVERRGDRLHALVRLFLTAFHREVQADIGRRDRMGPFVVVHDGQRSEESRLDDEVRWYRSEEYTSELQSR